MSRPVLTHVVVSAFATLCGAAPIAMMTAASAAAVHPPAAASTLPGEADESVGRVGTGGDETGDKRAVGIAVGQSTHPGDEVAAILDPRQPGVRRHAGIDDRYPLAGAGAEAMYPVDVE